MSHFTPGTTIAWRNCSRDATGSHRPTYASAMRIVHDRATDLALYRGPGYPMRRRDAEVTNVPGLHHPAVLRVLESWRPDPDWGRWRVLVLMDPDARHATSLFWKAETGELDFWYIDLIGPALRRHHGFDFIENGLDIVVEPDFSSWRWKDEDELQWNVEVGRYSREEADALYAEGKRALDDLLQRREWFGRWRSWRPPRTWDSAVLPEGWDAR